MIKAESIEELLVDAWKYWKEKGLHVNIKYEALETIEEFPIIGFYLYHVTSAGESSNWTTSGIKQVDLTS